MNNEAKKDVCFVVGVIGKPGSEQRVHADWVFDGIISPLFDKDEWECTRADRMNRPGVITSLIIEQLLEARLVIADLTFLNPNVFYEIGIRHMTGKPIIHVNRVGETIPFDISTFLSMEYSVAEIGLMELARSKLKDQIATILTPGYKIENPVTQTRGRMTFDETASTPDRLLRAEIDRLTGRLDRMEFMSQHDSLDVFQPTVRRKQGFDLFADDLSSALQIRLTSMSGPEALERLMAEVVLPTLPSDAIVVRPSEEKYVITFRSAQLPRETLDSWVTAASAAQVAVTTK